MSAKYRDRLLKAAQDYARAIGRARHPLTRHENFKRIRAKAQQKYVAEVDAIMLEISEREDRLLTIMRRIVHSETFIDRQEAERDARDFLKGKS